MFVYYFKAIGRYHIQHYNRLVIDAFAHGVNESRWMVPGTFDCDGNSTL